MNNKIKTTILGGLLSASIVAPALAGDFATPIQVSTPSVSGSDAFSFATGYHSKYVWRGQDLGDDLVDYSLETSRTVGQFDLTAGIWGANPLDGQGDSEVDFYLNASKDLGFATLDFGYIYYMFPNVVGDTQEVYVGLSKEIAGFDVSATYYYDFDVNDVSYLELGVEKAFVLPVVDEVTLSYVVGINPEDPEFSHSQITLSKSIQLNSEVSLTPYVSHTFGKDKDSNGAERDNEFLGGVSLGFDF